MTQIIEDKRTPEEVIADALAHYSVLDLREMSDESIHTGEEKLRQTETSITILEQGETNLIRWWKLASDGRNYEVRRLENFVFCSCLDFFYSKTMCKHIAVTLRFYCPRCQKHEVQFGQWCDGCSADTAPYLKQSATRPTERIGSVRI